MIPTSFLKKFASLLILTCLFAFSALAQTSGSLSGTVQDAQGGVLAGAKVMVSDITRNFQLDTTTNSDGTFTFTTLQPGTYTVTIEASGFKKVVKTGITLNAADRQSTGTIKLEIGQIGETVQIIADSEQLLIKTESGEQGTAVNNQQIQNLAIVLSTAAGRNRFARVDVLPAALDVTPLYVEWHGTLVGPGTYGAWGLAPYLIKVDRVDSLRAVQLRDCPRVNRYAARAPARFDTSAVLLAAWRAIEAVPPEAGRVRVLSVTSRVDLATVPLSPTVTGRLRDGGVPITRPVEHYGTAKRESFRVVDLERQADGTVVAVLASAFTIPDGAFERFGTHTVRLRVVCDARGCGATVISP